MDVYLGRQPILDRGWNVAGYELLFRSNQADYCDSTDGVSATSQGVVDAVLGAGLDRLLGGKPAFINFDRTLLLGDWTTLLPPDKVVIEIPETVPPEQEILSVCQRLRQQGYAVALHDSPGDGRTEAFAPFVDILKVDSHQTSRADQERIVSRYRKLKIRMVATNVETESEFRDASELGYDYLQGFFFASPAVLKTSRVPASQMNGLRLMKLLQREELDFAAIEELIRHDISFSHSLLTYLNSAAFHWANRVESVRQGLLLLGATEVRKWVSMASLSSLVQNRPPVLMAQVLMRGRFCEAIANSAKLPRGESDPFLLGMFSLLDAILNRPLQGILDELNIGRGIRAALLGTADETDILSRILRIVKSWEVGDWKGVESTAQAAGLPADALRSCYLESLCWVDTILSQDQPKWKAISSSDLKGFHRNTELLALV